MLVDETIAAIATPPGKGGVGIIRVSGKACLAIAQQVTGLKDIKPRYATYSLFKDEAEQTIDSGLVLYFKGPNSFTGEDVIEFQGHGGPVILQMLLKRVISLGARQANPGEFSERAFLNNKIDLTQAEAIADAIDSASEAAAKSAMRSLQGEFSGRINDLLVELIKTRMYVESAIDFPEEEIDFLSDGVVLKKIDMVLENLSKVESLAGSGELLQQGFTIALAGRPNAGKSTLLNTLIGDDVAIVTDIEGTTRDSIKVSIDVDGLPVHIVDTAGLRESEDKVERIGVERSRKIIDDADHVFLLVDIARKSELAELLQKEHLDKIDAESLSIVYTKKDAFEGSSDSITASSNDFVISAKSGEGIQELKDHIKLVAGYISEDSNVFSARKRHLDAIAQARDSILQGREQLIVMQAGELLAQELLEAQNALNSITGEFNADDLLGEIFSSFCIGK